MRKLIISLCLFALPAAYSFGQVNVSGVMGSDGYSVLRADVSTGLLIVPGLDVYASYALFQADDMSSMSRYAAGARYQLPFIELLSVGAEAGWQPKANQYSNYWTSVYGSLNLHELLFHLVPTDELKLDLGYRRTAHSFYNPEASATQNDIYAKLFQRTGGFDASVNFTKAISYSGDTNQTPPWLDVPGFVFVASGFLDYTLGANAGYTYKFIRPYAAYNFLKRKEITDTDTLGLGLIVQIAGVSVNGSVEWYNFSRNTEFRERFFSLSAGVNFL